MAEEFGALQSHVAALRTIAQEEFVEGLLDLIGELRLFGGAATQAIGEISVAEAWEGIERVVAAFVAQRLGRPSDPSSNALQRVGGAKQP